MGESSSCIECGHVLAAEDNFCPGCGHKIEVVEVEETAEVAPLPPKKSRRTVVIAGVVALGLIIAGAAWFGFSQQSEAKDQYKASSPVLMSDLDDMSSVQSTEMVQEVAGQAQTELTTIDATLGKDPQAKGADRLNILRDAFAAMAALQSYGETNTQVWTDNREPLLASLDTLTTYGEETQNATAAGEDVVRTLDDLTTRVDKAMKRYRKQVAKALAEARDERAKVRSYESQMRSLIGQYSALRRDTTEFIDYMYAADLYIFEVDEYFMQAATDRRSIANRMAALRPPAEMRGPHSRIVTLVGDGADAVDSAVGGLDDCYDIESSQTCYWEADSQWEQFQSESERITVSYDAALNAWGADIARARKAAKGADLPPKPDL